MARRDYIQPIDEPLVLAVGAVTGVATLIVQRRHHLPVRDAYAPEAVDRAAILVPAAQTAETA